jgi:hypothetical protein
LIIIAAQRAETSSAPTKALFYHRGESGVHPDVLSSGGDKPPPDNCFMARIIMVSS